jgi:hypothetical protein
MILPSFVGRYFWIRACPASLPNLAQLLRVPILDTLNRLKMKKHFMLTAVWLHFLLPVFSQNIAINADGSHPDPNAILDIQSGSKGLLIPRMGSAARVAIPNTRGLLVFDTTTNSVWYNTGTALLVWALYRPINMAIIRQLLAPMHYFTITAATGILLSVTRRYTK